MSRTILDNILSRKKGTREIFGVSIDYSWPESKKLAAYGEALYNHAYYLKHLQHRIKKTPQADGSILISLIEEK